MWSNYFWNIQKKYSMRVSQKQPLVIRLDGKDATKNKEINLLDKSEKGFLSVLIKSACYFSQKYKCYAIIGSDEISFICENPMDIIEDMGSDKSPHSNEIISVFSQFFFQYFNHFDKHKIVYWHAKCFSIPNEKIASYIKYRSRIIENVLVTYFLKKNSVKIDDTSISEKIKACEQLGGYKDFETYKNGLLYYCGKEISLEDFLNNGEIVIKGKSDEDINNMFSEII